MASVARSSRWMCVALVVGLWGCAQQQAGEGDLDDAGEVPKEDTGEPLPKEDTGVVPKEDTGVAPEDAGVAFDSGELTEDSGVAPIDAGNPQPIDAGNPVDTGVVLPTDTGPRDTGVVLPTDTGPRDTGIVLPTDTGGHYADGHGGDAAAGPHDDLPGTSPAHLFELGELPALLHLCGALLGRVRLSDSPAGLPAMRLKGCVLPVAGAARSQS